MFYFLHNSFTSILICKLPLSFVLVVHAKPTSNEWTWSLEPQISSIVLNWLINLQEKYFLSPLPCGLVFIYFLIKKLFTNIYIYIYVCVCVCVCVWWRPESIVQKERQEEEGDDMERKKKRKRVNAVFFFLFFFL